MRKRIIFVSLFFSNTALLTYFLFFCPVFLLDIRNYETGQVLYTHKIPAGYSFATSIRHSVHLTPVYEYYQVHKDGRIHVVATKLQDLGWGVPSTCAATIYFKDNFLVLSGLDIPLDFLPFRISYIAEPRLFLDSGQREIPLYKYFNDMERMDISVEKITYLQYLRRGESDVFQEKNTGRSYS
ncbi:DUF1850 domain-containing protein [Aminobacterium mobile]|uniref:DUF1850 domain-containing protein n=1 Tax=Aminobacterium mobile TaxID=81467 RepID=UPI0004635C48|nr:DUF1850 domain-containing protein [Aminobacterium mobile]